MSGGSGGPPHLRAVPPAGSAGGGCAHRAGRRRHRHHPAARAAQPRSLRLGRHRRPRLRAARAGGRCGRGGTRVGPHARAGAARDGALTSDQYARAVAERFGLDHVDLTVYKPDLSAAEPDQRPGRHAASTPCRSASTTTGALLVAMVDPSNVLALDDLKLMTGHEVAPVVASPRTWRADRPDEPPRRRRRRGGRGGGRGGSATSATSASRPTTRRSSSSSTRSSPRRSRTGASDIHFEPEGREMRVRFRVDGVLQRDHDDPAADGRRRDLAHQDHGRPRHLRAAAAAGRPRVADGRGPTPSTSAS